MPHFPKPFFRAARNRWYVQIDGHQINLGSDQTEAFRRYHELMAQSPPLTAIPSTPPLASSLTVAETLDRYLDWLSRRPGTAARTFDWYQKYLQSFLDSLTKPALAVADLEPVHVYRWLDLHPRWTTGRRGATIAVQRACNWAAKAGLFKSLGGRSPLAGLEKPAAGRREQVIAPAAFQVLINRVRDQPFRDLLHAAWDTGARPHELFTVEAAFVDFEHARWVFPLKISKGRKVRRVVYLSDQMLEITRRLVAQHPTGPLFRNAGGRPWVVSAAKCRFQRLQVALGTDRLQQLGLFPPPLSRLTVAQRQDAARRSEHAAALRARRVQIRALARAHGPRYSLYAFRHSFCTRSLGSGNLDAVTVAALMGHRDTAMISRVYAHLDQQPDHLRAAVNRSAGPSDA
jgi:integrase